MRKYCQHKLPFGIHRDFLSFFKETINEIQATKLCLCLGTIQTTTKIVEFFLRYKMSLFTATTFIIVFHLKIWNYLWFKIFFWRDRYTRSDVSWLRGISWCISWFIFIIPFTRKRFLWSKIRNHQHDFEIPANLLAIQIS